MDEQELAREAVKQARRDEMYVKPAAQRLEDFKPIGWYTPAGEFVEWKPTGDHDMCKPDPQAS